MTQLKTNISGLTLRYPDPTFAPQLASLIDENRTFLRQWLPWLDFSTRESDSQRFLTDCLNGINNGTQCPMALYLHEELIGMAGFNIINASNHSAEIGYWLSKEHCGHGYMTEGVRAVIQHGFQEYKLNRIVIKAATLNHHSRAIAHRLGFHHEGTLRQAEMLYSRYHDLEQYSLLHSDWL
ncbi:GNAT family protein [Reinekea marina]|uniref:GNAT family N-acetyltransferase n=1 Tax=Reinekea marina TaxID=1310421 RepID=A0ABV7WTL9_9GAMM|nr:GNAT family protein [Reinekea marina]MDN3649976.1 GNAT family protein [Reinekea marina]